MVTGGRPTAIAQETEIMKQLEQQHHCAECRKPCIILNSGEHYNFSARDLATWTELIVSTFICSGHCLNSFINFDSSKVRRRASILAPPPELNLDIARQRVAKRQSQASASESEPPVWMKQVGAVLGAVFGTFQAHQQPPPASSQFAQPSSSSPSFSFPPENPGRKRHIPDCPTISQWLDDLRVHPHRGERNYSQWKGHFDELDLFKLTDLRGLTPEKLQRLFDDKMPFGTAKRLLEYAEEDLEDLESTPKRARSF